MMAMMHHKSFPVNSVFCAQLTTKVFPFESFAVYGIHYHSHTKVVNNSYIHFIFCPQRAHYESDYYSRVTDMKGNSFTTTVYRVCKHNKVSSVKL